MREALKLAEEAGTAGEVPVGCVIVRDGEIVGRGRNRREQEKTALGHGEIEAIADALAAAGITASEAAVTRRPDNTIAITDVHTAEQVLKLIDKLEDLDDVQEVTGNFEIDDSIADQVNV